MLLPLGSLHFSSECGKPIALAGRGKDSPTGIYAILVKIGLYLQSLEEATALETGRDEATSVHAA